MSQNTSFGDAAAAVSNVSRGKIRSHYFGLSGWKKLLLMLAMTLAFVGSSGTIWGLIRGQPEEVAKAQATIESIKSTASGANLTPEQNAQLDRAKEKVKAAGHWFYEKTAPQLAKVGFGFFVAFVLGYAFRQFIKTMAMLTALALALGGVAAYFGWIDFSAFRENLSTGTNWVTNQFDGAKQFAMRFIGAGMSGTIGFVVGFLRR